MADKLKHLDKAEKLLRRGKMDDALGELLFALDADPADNALRQRAADLCLTMGRGGEAARLLSEMFDRDVAAGDHGSAITTFRKLAKLTPPTPHRSLAFGRLVEKSNKKEARDAYEAALEAFRQQRRVRDALEAAAALANLEPSIENLKREGELAAEAGDNPRAALAMVRAGKAEDEAGTSPLESFQRAFQLAPELHEVVLQYGCALLKAEEYQTAILILEPLARSDADKETLARVRVAYGEALLAVGRPIDAEPFVWELAQGDPAFMPLAYRLLGALFKAAETSAALAFARKLERHAEKAGKRREYILELKKAAEWAGNQLTVLEYLAESFNSFSESDYCATLLKLFELYYAQGNFLKAADCLDRAAEVDAYEKGHRQRLEMLRGKVAPAQYNTIANRIGASSLRTEAHEIERHEEEHGVSTVLEDLILQAEIFLQYGMRSRAVERLERIRRLFPGEEAKNQKLYHLYTSAGMEVKVAPVAVATTPSGKESRAAHDAIVDNVARITEIARNVYRQGNVKSVLFTAVNEVGRHWGASRCIAVLAGPGKPPSIALEYVAPGLTQSEVMTIVKMVALLQPVMLAHGPIEIGVQTKPIFGPLKQFFAKAGIESVLAVPLVDGEEHVGLLVLAQSGTARDWQQTDVVMLKTIAEQISQAVSNAKLRSLVKNLAVTEERSGLLKRASYLDMLTSEVRRAQAQKSMLTLMLMSFGNAAELLKEFGEAAVEQLMRDIGQLVSSHTRQHDFAVRYDRSIIALILAETNEANAHLVAQKLRKVVAATRLPGTDEPPRLAAGIAECVLASSYDPVDIVTEVINRAESALEGALKEGPEAVKSIAPQVSMAGTA